MVSCTEPGPVSPGNKLISEERKLSQEKSAIVFIVFLPKSAWANFQSPANIILIVFCCKSLEEFSPLMEILLVVRPTMLLAEQEKDPVRSCEEKRLNIIEEKDKLRPAEWDCQ